LWEAPLFGSIAYVGGEPASGAFAFTIDEALYVAWVATSKTHRRLGLAELVIRASLEDARKATGIERTVLHATEDGFPVYLRMGYRSVVRFPLYGTSERMTGEKWHWSQDVWSPGSTFAGAKEQGGRCGRPLSSPLLTSANASGSWLRMKCPQVALAPSHEICRRRQIQPERIISSNPILPPK